MTHNHKGYRLSAADNEADFFTEAFGEISPGKKPLSGSNSLLAQLSQGSPEATLATLGVFFRSGGAIALATFDSDLVGMACLVPTIKINGTVGRIEHVVIDERHRGKGLGRLLVEAAIALGKSRGYRYLDLTTNPARSEANALYAKLGFVRQETNLYRFGLPGA